MENLICEGIDLILCTVIWAGLSGFLWGGGKGKDKSFFIYAILSVFTAPLVVLLVGSFKMSLGLGHCQPDCRSIGLSSGPVASVRMWPYARVKNAFGVRAKGVVGLKVLKFQIKFAMAEEDSYFSVFTITNS